MLDSKGKHAGTGSYEEWWAGPDTWKRTYTGDGSGFTVYDLAGAVARTGPEVAAPYPDEMLLDLPAMALPTNKAMAHMAFVGTRTAPIGNTSLVCFNLAPQELNAERQRLSTTSYCMEKDRPVLRAVLYPGGNQAILQKLGMFAGRFVGLEVAYYCGHSHCGQASLDTLEALPRVANDFFNPPPDSKPYSPPAAVMEAQKVSGNTPVYPEMAKAQRVQGEVLLRVIVGADGQVQQVTPIFGPQELIESAKTAVRTWRYQPFQLNGTSVSITTTAHVIFQLR